MNWLEAILKRVKSITLELISQSEKQPCMNPNEQDFSERPVRKVADRIVYQLNEIRVILEIKMNTVLI